MPAGHDFNALLIGALYGELSAVEESRLQAHLAAHPGDHQLLRELTRTREAIRTSAVLAVVEPPQAISALLLQEAARRAPRAARSPEAGSAAGSWLMRLASGLFAHPGWAAAMMAVLVVGVFGTLALRGKHQVVDSTVSSSSSPAGSPAGAPAEFGASAPSSAAPAAALAEDSAEAPLRQPVAATPEPYAVDLAPEDRKAETPPGGPAQGKDDRKAKKNAPVEPDVVGAARDRASKGDKLVEGKADEPMRPARLAKPTGYVEAKTRDELELKDFDSSADVAKAPSKQAGPAASTADSRSPSRAGSAAQIATADDGLDAKERERSSGKRAQAEPQREEAPPAAAPAPPPPAAAAPTSGLAPVVSTETVATKPAYDDAWARSEHVRLVRLARASKCSEAAAVARTLSERASRYYQDHVAGDRELRVCAAAIRDQLNLQSEQTKRKRAPAPAERADDATRK